MSQTINVHRSTVYREIKQNGSRSKSRYIYRKAQELAHERKERIHGNRAVKFQIKREALSYLQDEQWLPKQISGYMERQGLHISHQTIYALIRKDREQGGDLYKNCSHKLKSRKRPAGKFIPIQDRAGIEERPKEAGGKRFGDYEMDTIVGKDGESAIVTIVERKTNLIMMKRLPKGKNAKALAEEVVRMLLPYKNSIKAITTDNGTGFALQFVHEIRKRDPGMGARNSGIGTGQGWGKRTPLGAAALRT